MDGSKPPSTGRSLSRVYGGALRQLHAARYTYHRQMIHKYGLMVRSMNIGEAQADELYRTAMDNYDGIIKAAADGASQEANEADMEKGFAL
ncbi:MAG: hypothetical protein KAI73_01095 [Rhodospirillaceae bacterium]|nr:hypothetical protein [Rhodospirillaceae bacterium]